MDNLADGVDALDQRIAELENELEHLKRDAPRPPLSVMLTRLFEANVIPMNRSHIDGKFLQVNQAFADLLGYTREELLCGEIGWNDITPSEYNGIDQHALRHILETERAEIFEKYYIRKDGTRTKVLLACTACNSDGDEILCFAINLREIKNAESQIERTEEQFRLLVDSVPQIVFSGDSLGNLKYLNQRFSDFTGLEKEKGLERSWIDLIHPDDLQQVMDQWTFSAQSGNDFELEFRHQNQDGSYQWSLCRSVPAYDEHQNIAFWIGTATNIDAQKQIQEELSKREERFRLLTEAVPQIIWTASANGKIDYLNHRWLEYTGLTIEQSLDGAWELLIHPADLQEYKRKWNSAVESGETYEHDFRLKRAVGLSSKTKDPPVLVASMQSRSAAQQRRSHNKMVWNMDRDSRTERNELNPIQAPHRLVENR